MVRIAARLGRGLLWASVLLISSPAHGQIVKKGAGYTFRAKYVKGAKQQFLFNTLITPIGSANMGSAKQNLTMPVLMRVLDVSKQGAARIQSQVGPIRMNGTVARPMTITTVRVDSLNRLLGADAKNLPQFATPLPTKAIKPGESWSANIDASEEVGERIRVKATYTLTRVVGTKAYLSLKLASVNEKNAAVKTTGAGRMVLRTADGSLESMEMMQTVTLSANRGGARTTIYVRRQL